MKKPDLIYSEALDLKPVSEHDALYLYNEVPLSELMHIGQLLREKHVPGNKVGWIIDRNVNITNVCFSQCSFCNFCRRPIDKDTYITTMDEYRGKIRVLKDKGGDQLLLQGGMHPDLGLDFYTGLFRELKNEFSGLKLHALGPPEVVYLAKKERLSYRKVLELLRDSGLDSLPGAGAEILVDRVRKIVSPAKATTNEWLEVMKEAHIMNLPTSATMMYGHIETPADRIRHLFRLRELQDIRPAGSYGFITFIPWPFQPEGTVLAKKHHLAGTNNMTDYIRLIAISRIVLNNIQHLQSSILTVGKNTAMLTLHSGADDLGSVMIEENVVSSAGSSRMYNAGELQSIIMEAGFVPRQRNQLYETVKS